MKSLQPAGARPYITLFFLTVAATASLLSYVLLQSRNQALARAAADASNLAWVIEDHISATLRRADAYLINLAGELSPAALEQSAVPRQNQHWTHELANYKVNFPEVSNFYVFDRHGQSLYTSDARLAPFNIADRPHFQLLKRDAAKTVVISDVVVAKSTGRPTISLARALRAPDGSFQGMTAALLDFGYFQSMFDAIDLGRHGLIAVRNADNHKLILRHPPRPEEVNKRIATELTRRVDSGERAGVLRLTSPIDNITRVFSFRVMSSFPMNVTVAIAERDALALWYTEVLITVGAASVFLAVFGVLLWRVGRDEQQRIADMDELERRETQLIEAKLAAEAANKAKSTFLASMSHELRTPLNSVLGFSQLLAMDDKLSAQVRENAGEIERAGRHLLALVNDVLDLARIESGRMEVNLESVELDRVLGDCQRLVAMRAREHGVTLTMEPTAVKLKADPVRLRQVLLNLISNAVKYNRMGGSVVVRGESKEGQRYRILVTDTGVGIATERLKDLFKPFNRLGAEGGSVEGTGIGLVITQSLVGLMHGNLGVTSTPGVGSTFWVEFPLAS